MNAAIRIRAKRSNGMTEVMLLMPHPMETGLRKGADGRLVPAHFITDLQVHVEGRMVMSARLSHAVSQDPLIGFRFKGGNIGQRVTVAWVDNTGQARSDSAAIS